MDKLKNLASKVGNSSGDKGGDKAQGGQGGAGGKEDYLDKGLDAAEKKFGFSQSRETNEKITDGAREQFEKATGKNVPDKFSN